MSKLYDELAEWWPLLSPVEDYADEAAFFAEVLARADLPAAPALLELGSGGGNNAFYLKHGFASTTLSDLSPAMLAVSRRLNPECPHIEGDMRELRLGRTFEAVFIHDAIDFMVTPQDLRRALETAYIHCGAGGVALVVPDCVRETFEPSTDYGGSDGDGRALRYLEWSYDPDADDTSYVTDYVYVLREDGRPPQIEHDHDICGLFPRDEWLGLLRGVGFQTVEAIRDSYGRDLFLARKPS